MVGLRETREGGFTAEVDREDCTLYMFWNQKVDCNQFLTVELIFEVARTSRDFIAQLHLSLLFFSRS